MSQQAIKMEGGVIDAVDKAKLVAMLTELYAAKDAQENHGKVVTIGAPVAGAANTTTCTLTVTDEDGDAVAAIHTLDVWVSDDADGNGLTATAASGTLTATTGTILTALTAKKHIRANTNAAGFLPWPSSTLLKPKVNGSAVRIPPLGRLLSGQLQ